MKMKFMQLINETGSAVCLILVPARALAISLPKQRVLHLPSGSIPLGRVFALPVMIQALSPLPRTYSGKFDGVICTDVLEHVPDEDIAWVVMSFSDPPASSFMRAAACYPARKKLPNGQNAHITQQQPEWWKGWFSLVARRYPNIRWRLCAVEKGTFARPGSSSKATCKWRRRHNQMLQYGHMKFDYEPYPIGVARPALAPDFYRALVEEFPPAKLFEYKAEKGGKYSLSQVNHANEYARFIRSSAPWRKFYDYIKSTNFIDDALRMLKSHEIDLGFPFTR